MNVCAFGETGEGWLGAHHCVQCWRSVQAARRGFAQAVAAGKYDRQGYTPAERIAERRKAAKA